MNKDKNHIYSTDVTYTIHVNRSMWSDLLYTIESYNKRDLQE